MNVRVGVDTQPMEQGLTKSKALLLGFAGGIGAAVAGIVGNAIRNVGTFISDSVRMAGEELQAQNQLLVALKGRVSAQQTLINQASVLAGKSLFEDDDIVKAQAMLAAFIKEEEQIKKLTPVVLDLAQAKSLNLAQAADLVGRAVGSEMKTIRGLGIELEGAAGSAEKVDSAVRALTEAFGGQAAAALKTGTGPLKQMVKLWGELKEEIGKKLLPILATFAAWVNDNLPKITAAIANFGGDSVIWFARVQRAFANMAKEFRYYKDIFAFGPVVAEALRAAQSEINDVRFDRIVAEVEAAKNKTTELSSAIEAAGKATKGTKTETKEISKAWLEQADAFELAQQRLETYKQFLDAMTEAVATRVLPRSQELIDAWAEQGEELAALEPEVEAAIESYKKLDSNLNGVKDSVEELNASLNNISEQALEGVIGLVADQAGQLAVGATTIQAASKAILFAIADFLEQFGKALIAYGISVEAFKKAFADPVAAVIAGAALISTAAIARSILDRGANVPALAEGGLAYSPTMAIVGDNPNAKSDPEVIAPLSKLAGMLRKQGGDVTVRGRLVGEDIYLSNERAFRRINRANGY